jgi:hypothetical protein
MIDKYEPCSICEEYIEGVICNKDKCPVAKMKAEFEKLRTDYGNMAQHALILIGNARTEAVKEFAERLTDKADLKVINAFESSWVISQELIDNLVKEMEGEG